MPELLVVLGIAAIVGVVGVGFGMLLAPRIARLDDGMDRDGKAEER